MVFWPFSQLLSIGNRWFCIFKLITMVFKTRFKIRWQFGGQMPEKIMYLAVLLISNMHQGQWLANKLNFQKIIGFPTLNTEIQKIFWLKHEKIAKNWHFRVWIFKYLSTKYSEKMAKCHQRASKMANYHQRNTKITRKHKKCWQNTQC